MSKRSKGSQKNLSIHLLEQIKGEDLVMAVIGAEIRSRLHAI